ncbi:MAG: glycerophosphodiester phosphodiesterase [Beijerinckiaceae bacterium]|nr:glycerophosphodiester phosphodiesterase [Beijerinckiaceae bacterium]
MSLDWLVARPIAHRGLHDRAGGVIENSLVAADLAVAAHYAIECDVQMSSDGEAFVFHDERLGRLTGEAGAVCETSAAALSRMRLVGAASDAPLPSLDAFLERVGRRVPVIIEIKSRFDGDMRLAERTARTAAEYEGAVALKSFDPAIIAHLRAGKLADGVPLGIVAQARYEHHEWDVLGATEKQSLSCLLHWRDTRPDFLSYCVDDLPHAAAHLARTALQIPVMTWTVRTPAQWAIARAHADQAIFEGAVP